MSFPLGWYQGFCGELFGVMSLRAAIGVIWIGMEDRTCFVSFIAVYDDYFMS